MLLVVIDYSYTTSMLLSYFLHMTMVPVTHMGKKERERAVIRGSKANEKGKMIPLLNLRFFSHPKNTGDCR